MNDKQTCRRLIWDGEEKNLFVRITYSDWSEKVLDNWSLNTTHAEEQTSRGVKDGIDKQSSRKLIWDEWEVGIVSSLILLKTDSTFVAK